MFYDKIIKEKFYAKIDEDKQYPEKIEKKGMHR